jgi:hypothetical protein
LRESRSQSNNSPRRYRLEDLTATDWQAESEYYHDVRKESVKMPDERSTGQLIGRIEVSPKEVETGESFLVEVFAPDGTSYANSNDVQVIVNGVTGGRQYLQIARAGDREIGVLVSDGSRFEKRTESVTVKESVP